MGNSSDDEDITIDQTFNPIIQPILYNGHFFAVIMGSSDPHHPVISMTFYTCHRGLSFPSHVTEELISRFKKRYRFSPGHTYDNLMFGRHAYPLSRGCTNAPWECLSSALYTWPVSTYEILDGFKLNFVPTIHSPVGENYLIEDMTGAVYRHYAGFTRDELIELHSPPEVLCAFDGVIVTQSLVIDNVPKSVQDTPTSSCSDYAANIPCIISQSYNSSFSTAIATVRSTSARTRQFYKPFKQPTFVIRDYPTVEDFAVYISDNMAHNDAPPFEYYTDRKGFNCDVQTAVIFWITHAMDMANKYATGLKSKKQQDIYLPKYTISPVMPRMEIVNKSVDLAFITAPDGSLIMLIPSKRRILYFNGSSYSFADSNEARVITTYRPLSCKQLGNKYIDYDSLINDFQDISTRINTPGKPPAIIEKRFSFIKNSPIELCGRYCKPITDHFGFGLVCDLFMIAYLVNVQPSRRALEHFPVAFPSSLTFDYCIKAYISKQSMFVPEYNPSHLAYYCKESVYPDVFRCNCDFSKQFGQIDTYVSHFKDCSY